MVVESVTEGEIDSVGMRRVGVGEELSAVETVSEDESGVEVAGVTVSEVVVVPIVKVSESGLLVCSADVVASDGEESSVKELVIGRKRTVAASDAGSGTTPTNCASGRTIASLGEEVEVGGVNDSLTLETSVVVNTSVMVSVSVCEKTTICVSVTKTSRDCICRFCRVTLSSEEQSLS